MRLIATHVRPAYDPKTILSSDRTAKRRIELVHAGQHRDAARRDALEVRQVAWPILLGNLNTVLHEFLFSLFDSAAERSLPSLGRVVAARDHVIARPVPIGSMRPPPVFVGRPDHVRAHLDVVSWKSLLPACIPSRFVTWASAGGVPSTIRPDLSSKGGVDAWLISESPSSSRADRHLLLNSPSMFSTFEVSTPRSWRLAATVTVSSSPRFSR